MSLTHKVLAAAAAGPTPLQGAYWAELGLVLLVTVVAAGILVLAYSTGIKLWAQAVQRQEAGDAAVLSRLGAVLSFTAAIVVILYGLYLIIPYFHQ